MGLFSKVGNFLSSTPVAGSLMGMISPEVGAGYMGYKGQQEANETNIQIAREANAASLASAREQMGFQKGMSDTAYQRSMKDMEAAGLNPMLAYSQGGASTPSGAMASMQTAKVESAAQKGIESAMVARQMKKATADVKFAEESAKQKITQQKLDVNSAKNAEKTNEVINEQLRQLKAQTHAIEAESGLRVDRANYDQKWLHEDRAIERTRQLTGAISDAVGAFMPKVKIDTGSTLYKNRLKSARRNQ